MTRAELEARADALGVEYAHNIGDEKLADRVAAAEAAAAGAEEGGARTAPSGPPPSGLVVVVTGPEGGFRRAGRRFGPEPVEIPLEALSEAEKAALAGEPMLAVTTRDASPA